MEEEILSQAPDQSLRVKLNGMFSRYDYVGIKNPLKKPFSWAVSLEQNEIVSVGMSDGMNEAQMARQNGGAFLPGDSVTRGTTKITRVVLEPSEKRMIIGEAAYVVVPRLFSALVREKYGTSKSGLAKLRNPSIQSELIKEIVDGPVINNINEAMQTYVNEKMNKIEGFTDVQVAPKATRESKKTEQAL